jgi:hypothetical protein
MVAANQNFGEQNRQPGGVIFRVSEREQRGVMWGYLLWKFLWQGQQI